MYVAYVQSETSEYGLRLTCFGLREVFGILLSCVTTIRKTTVLRMKP